jgi:hypothetical protein
MSVLPQGWRGSTTLNTSITSYDTLSVRIQHQLGAPLINLEVFDEQVYSFIDEAMELFTKWAGYTEEYMIFDSKLYVPGVGIKVDDLINRTHRVTNRVTDVTSVTGVYDYEYDYDLASYRKVVDCFSFDKGEDTGINTLFTLEQAMSNSIYSSYMVGNMGFDLVTWEVLKGFIDTRDKVLAMTPHFRFDSRNQILKILPEPQSTHTYLGVVGCYIERPIKELIKEKFIHKYVLALTRVAIALVRGKFNGTNLFAGGSVNFADMLSQGLADKEKLEQELMNSYIDSTPPRFLIG